MVLLSKPHVSPLLVLDRHSLWGEIMELVIIKTPEGYFLAAEDQFKIKHRLAKFLTDESVAFFDAIMTKKQQQTNVGTAG
jgi:hypothetical protein